MLERKHYVQRPDYTPAAPHEAFIVPLVRQEVEAALEAYLPAVHGGRVLDVGCGRQPFRALLEAQGFHYVGLDVEQNPEGTVDVLCEIDQPLPESCWPVGRSTSSCASKCSNTWRTGK